MNHKVKKTLRLLLISCFLILTQCQKDDLMETTQLADSTVFIERKSFKEFRKLPGLVNKALPEMAVMIPCMTSR